MLKEITLLFADDDAYFRQWMNDSLGERCAKVLLAANGAEALELFRIHQPDMVLTDVYMPEMDGLELSGRIRELAPGTPIVLYTAFTDVPLLIKGIELGVAGFVQKPPDLEHLVATLERAALPVVQRRKLRGLEEDLLLSVEQIIGKGEALRSIAVQICRMAKTDYPVLIQGETGTGKSRLARIIHNLSPRSKAPFISVQLSSLSENLITAELFGHEKGAFTGADRRRDGLVAAAREGTLFLDDVDSASPAVQSLLLQLVEEKCFCRPGSNKVEQVDIRIIAATNRDLSADARSGSFRQDLFFRLAALFVELPPLRTFISDVAVFAEQFLLETGQELGLEAPALDSGAIEALMGHSWPGNIRELRNVIRRAAMVADRIISREIVQNVLETCPDSSPHGVLNCTGLQSDFSPPGDLPMNMAAVENWALQRALTAAQGKKMVAARLLDMNYYTFCRRLARYSLD